MIDISQEELKSIAISKDDYISFDIEKAKKTTVYCINKTIVDSLINLKRKYKIRTNKKELNNIFNRYCSNFKLTLDLFKIDKDNLLNDLINYLYKDTLLNYNDFINDLSDLFFKNMKEMA